MIKIITDSSSDMTSEVVAKYGVEVLPLLVDIDGKTYRDGIDLSHDEFYELLRTCKQLPKTSQVNEFAFAAAYAKYPNDDIISIHISSDMSGTYSSAVKAAKASGRDNVFVVDSRNTTIPLGALIIETAKFALTHTSPAEVLDYIQTLIKKVRMYAVVGSLKYLRAGGRISAIMAAVGSILQIKPIMSIKDGKVYNVHKSIGLKNAIANIVRLARDHDERFPLYFGHTDTPDALMNLIQQNYADREIPSEQILKVGSTVGTHIGPGCYCVVIFLKDELMSMPLKLSDTPQTLL